MRFLCGALLAILLSTSAEAAVDCSAQFYNQNVGDTLRGSVHWDGLTWDDNGVRWQDYTTSGAQLTWDRAFISPSYPDASFSFVAGVRNESMWFVQTAGGPDKMSCYFYDLSVTPVQGWFVLPNISKQTYHAVGNTLNGVAVAFTVWAGYAKYIGDGYSALILASSAAVSGFVGNLLTQVDPWDDAYAYPYDPVFRNPDELGLEYLYGGTGNDFWDIIAYDNNLIVYNGLNIEAYLQAANISINRATSCQQVGDSCADWQAERARQFFEAANQYACSVAAAKWELAYQYGQQGFGQDYQDAWNESANQFYSMCQNGVR